jgi:ribosomal protein S8
MVRISVLNDALKNMFNAEKRGKRQVLLKPSSKVIIKFLTVMQKHGTSPKSFFFLSSVLLVLRVHQKGRSCNGLKLTSFCDTMIPTGVW